LVVLGTVGSACGPAPPPQQVDELEAQSRLAQHDSELAAAAATGESPQMAGALKQVAAERAQHAAELDAEIARVSGRTRASSSTSRSPAPGGAATPHLDEVLGSLRASADSAARLAIVSSGYRAGLLASIAAACTAAYTVALAPPESSP
jgi:hypothetical protein